jgi:hypothetical protein
MKIILKSFFLNIKIGVIFLFILLSFFICLISCTKEDNLQTNEKTVVLKTKLQDLLEKPDQEIVALLAAKYCKDVQVIEKIIDSYLTETEIGYKTRKLVRQRENIPTEEIKKELEDSFYKNLALDKSIYYNKIKLISKQYSIDETIIASILFDYKTWENATKSGSE